MNQCIFIDTSSKILQSAQDFLGAIHTQNRKIVWDSVHKLDYDIPKRNLSMS